MEKNVVILDIDYVTYEYIPDFIYQAIQTERLQQTTFSKYYMCRKYGMGGIVL